jgi:hypothetical protein
VDFTGASGAIPRGDIVRQEAHAKLFYEEVRKRTGDVEKIAANTGFSVEDIEKIKNHVFFNEYDLGESEPTRFDPSYDLALSWQRLTEGKSIQEMDLTLLHHELMEYRLMNEDGLRYREAHDKTEREHNSTKYARALDKKEGLI